MSDEPQERWLAKHLSISSACYSSSVIYRRHLVPVYIKACSACSNCYNSDSLIIWRNAAILTDNSLPSLQTGDSYSASLVSGKRMDEGDSPAAPVGKTILMILHAHYPQSSAQIHHGGLFCLGETTHTCRKQAIFPFYRVLHRDRRELYVTKEMCGLRRKTEFIPPHHSPNNHDIIELALCLK